MKLIVAFLLLIFLGEVLFGLVPAWLCVFTAFLLIVFVFYSIFKRNGEEAEDRIISG